MCGINCIVSFGSSIDNGKELVAAMNTAIAHRGPDDLGYWAYEQRKVHFGHLRLSIIDLSPAGHQPMISANGNVIIFNGEIYNYKEIKPVIINILSISNDQYYNPNTGEALEILRRAGEKNIINNFSIFSIVHSPNIAIHYSGICRNNCKF